MKPPPGWRSNLLSRPRRHRRHTLEAYKDTWARRQRHGGNFHVVLGKLREAVVVLGQNSLLCVAHTPRPTFASVSRELNTAFAIRCSTSVASADCHEKDATPEQQKPKRRAEENSAGHGSSSDAGLPSVTASWPRNLHETNAATSSALLRHRGQPRKSTHMARISVPPKV